jgi:hypothetical protein
MFAKYNAEMGCFTRGKGHWQNRQKLKIRIFKTSRKALQQERQCLASAHAMHCIGQWKALH